MSAINIKQGDLGQLCNNDQLWLVSPLYISFSFLWMFHPPPLLCKRWKKRFGGKKTISIKMPENNSLLIFRDAPNTNSAVFLNIVQKPFDSPLFLSFEHLVDNFRPLLGHLLGHYEFCSFLGYGLGMGLDMTPLPFWTMIKNWKIRFGAFLSWKYTSYQSGDGSHHARSTWPAQDEKHFEKE